MIAPRYIGLLITLFAAITFGAYPSATQLVYKNGGNVSFILLVTVLVRTLVLTLFCRFTHKPLFPDKTAIRTGFVSGFYQAASLISLFIALNYLSGPVVLIIMYTHTLMLLFFMAWKKEYTLTRAVFAVTCLALAGLSLVLGVWQETITLSPMGVALAFFAALCTVGRLYEWGRLTKNRNAAVIGAETFLFASLFIVMFAVLQTPQLPHHMTGYLWAGVATVSMVLGTFGMFYGIAWLGSFEYSLMAKLEPVFTALFAYLIIGDLLTPAQYIGMALTLGSLAVFQITEHKRNKNKSL